MQVPEKISAAGCESSAWGCSRRSRSRHTAQAQTNRAAGREGRAGLRLRDRLSGAPSPTPRSTRSSARAHRQHAVGAGAHVGRWLPTRYSAQGRQGGERTFADSGFVLGLRYRWRVRALISTHAGGVVIAG